MKKNLRYASLPLLLLFAFCACKKDLGNYDYADAATVTITTDMATADPKVVITNDSLVVKQDDSLKLDIIVAQSLTGNEMSYQWIVTQNALSVSNPSQHVVGNEKSLRTKISMAPGLYKLAVRATDKKTGVSYYKFYNLVVDTAPWGNEGWLVLQDQAAQGGSDVSIITTRDGAVRGGVYADVYSVANGHKLPVGTNKMAVLNYHSSLRIQKLSFFYPNGGVQVRSIDYLDSNDHTGWFFVPPSTFNIQANDVFPATGQYEYVINDGQLYAQSVNATSIKSPPIKLGAPMLGSWPELSPYMILGNADGVYSLFDKVNRCFLTVWNNGGTLTLVPTSRADVPNSHYAAYSGSGGAANLTATGKGFDMNNIGRDLVYTENVSPMSGTIYYDCIFRNTAKDSTFMYQIPGAATGAGGGYGNNFASGRFYLSETKNPGINTASLFAMPTFLTISATTYGVFYYVHGTNKNSIYVCSPSYTGTLPATTTSSLGYSFPAGTVIKAMKVLKSGYTAAPATEGKVLVVATDETASGNGNNVYFFNLTATGGISSTPAQVYTGFDKIVDIAFKKGLGL